MMSKEDFLAATNMAVNLTLDCDSQTKFAEASQAPEDDGDNVKIIKTACRACIPNCGILATVKNGRVMHVEGIRKIR